jgi:hypothetical protein
MPAQANSLPDCILKTPITKKKKADVVAQDEGSEFKPQHCKKKKKSGHCCLAGGLPGYSLCYSFLWEQLSPLFLIQMLLIVLVLPTFQGDFKVTTTERIAQRKENRCKNRDRWQAFFLFGLVL